MARIHVLYDPRDVIEIPKAEWLRATGAKAAIMPISSDLTQDEIADVVTKVTTLLLEQIAPPLDPDAGLPTAQDVRGILKE